MDYELDPIPTEEWLAALGHDQAWLERWTARPIIDKEAVTEWLVQHRYSTPQLMVRSYFGAILERGIK